MTNTIAKIKTEKSHHKIEGSIETGEVGVYFIDADDQKFDVAYLENLVSAAKDIEKIL
jgi:hypothetical protein